MKNIVLEKKGGSILPLNSKSPLISVITAQVQEVMMGDSIFTMEIESALPVDFEVGDKVKVFNRYYYLNRLPQVERVSSRHLKYSVTMESAVYFLSHVLLTNTYDNPSSFNATEADFTFTADARGLLNMLCQNMNRVYGDGLWSWEIVDNGVDEHFNPEYDKVHSIAFSSQNVLSALVNINELWRADYRVEETSTGYVIQVGRYGQDIHQYTFSYGKGNGLYSLTRTSSQDSVIITRLYAYGSSQNLGAGYREGRKRLALPLSGNDERTRNGLYIQDDAAVERYGLVEGAVMWDDIYPHREGVVSAIDSSSELCFCDEEMYDLNAKDEKGNSLYLISGASLAVHFNTGALAGYEFSVAGYNSITHRFTLIPFTDENDYTYPSPNDAAFRIAVGDKYVLLGLSLPDEYISKAESELEKRAVEKYEECIARSNSYQLSIEEDFLKRYFPVGDTGHAFRVGDYIHIYDSDITDETLALRVMAVNRDVYRPWSYNLTLGKAAPASFMEQIVKETVENSRVIHHNKLKDLSRARRNTRTTAEVIDMTFDSDGYFIGGKIRPETVETMVLNVGATSGNFTLEGVQMTVDAAGYTSQFEFTDGVLSHFGLDKEKVITWNIMGGTIYELEDDKAYYIYARCGKNDSSGTIIASRDAYRYNIEGEFYYFLIGVLSSVMDGYRTLSASYGTTLINGRELCTGVIKSVDGNTYFDLDAGEIGGRIVLSDKSRTDAGETIISGGKLNNLLIDTDTLVAKKIESREGTIADFTIQEKQLVGDGNKVIFSNEVLPTLEDLLSKGDTTYPIGNSNVSNGSETSTMGDGRVELSLNAYVPTMEIPYAGMMTFRVRNTRSITWNDEGGRLSTDASNTNVRVQRIDADGSLTDTAVYAIEPNTIRTISTYIPQAGSYRVICESNHECQSMWIEDGNEQPYPTYTLDAKIELLGVATDGMVHLIGGQECTQIGTDGFYSFWSVINYLYFSQDEGLKFKGDFTATSSNGEYKLAITDNGIIITGDVSADYSSGKVLFDIAKDRTNVESGETFGELFGKVQRYFTDLKSVAFTGSYNSLTDKPEIPTIPEIPDVSSFITTEEALSAISTYTYSREEIEEKYVGYDIVGETDIDI